MSDLKKNTDTNNLPITNKEKVETILILSAIGVGGIFAVVLVGKIIGLIIPIGIVAIAGYFVYPYVKQKLK
jgi:hypothetical protein